MKPDHWTEAKTCKDCIYCKLKKHHCSCCSHWDVYECTHHWFEMDDSEKESRVCNDWLAEE